ncbi:hypothetical protein Y032_0010g886 [Ancylostoma ceylanicum]|uniref:Uncharacterized protein n=1 Tax=Ancylostoma ceylanicum TaxID=53326 RepID=A0A016VGA6_9BILA|nr:hypothetical protein Y032_0010g886 [Ancylostoma ceylanicum]
MTLSFDVGCCGHITVRFSYGTGKSNGFLFFFCSGANTFREESLLCEEHRDGLSVGVGFVEKPKNINHDCDIL